MPPTRTSLSSSDQRRGERAPLPPTPPTGRPGRRFLHAPSASSARGDRRVPLPRPARQVARGPMARDAKRMLYVQTTGTESPERSATVFFLAASAAALDIEVGIYFTQFGPTLLQRGVPEALQVKRG